MAKVEMKYMEVVSPMSDAKKILDLLQLRGVIELKDLDDIYGMDNLGSERTVSSIEKYYDTAQTALSILDKYSPQKSALTDMLKGLPEMSYQEYLKKSDEADEILGICLKIVSAEKAIADNKANIARCRASMDAVEPWLPLDVPMQYKGTKETVAYIGTLPADYTADALDIAIAGALDKESDYSAEVVSHTKDRSCVFVLSTAESSESVFAALRSLGFSYPSDPTKHAPNVRYERLQKEIDRSETNITESGMEIVSLASYRDDIKFVADWFSVRRDKYEALSKVCAGDSFIAFGGYIPAGEADKLVNELEEKYTVAITVEDTEEDNNAPVLLENKPFVAALEPITEMYAQPSKDDIDPNPVMAIFYYLLFGIMLSDAGYGLIMAIGCGIAKFGFKVKGKLKKTVDMYFWCGLATVFWGALFGSWFGDIVTRVAHEFFGKTLITPWLDPSTVGEMGSIALWFEPVNNPMKLMLFSFLFGIIHLFAGVGCSFVKMWKMGNKVGAVCDCVPLWLLITGLVPIGANIFQAGTFPDSVTGISKWIAIAGAVLIIATAGRDSKNIVGKLGLGLYGLYNTASGWLGDILSYSRLLALGLCTGVIATVVNTLGTIPENKVVKAILLVFVFIFGHVVNLAINLIGTYVHTNRLQYVEFFSKFYEGGGRSFTPLKINSKYYNFKED